MTRNPALATAFADATSRATSEVTGIVSRERLMTWTEQGVHAAAFNAVMFDEQLAGVLHARDREAGRLSCVACREWSTRVAGGMSVCEVHFVELMEWLALRKGSPVSWLVAARALAD